MNKRERVAIDQNEATLDAMSDEENINPFDDPEFIAGYEEWLRDINQTDVRCSCEDRPCCGH